MTAEIITIGDELLIGQVLDTNSAWIAKRLNDSGLRVVRRVSVGDTREAITAAADEALRSAGVTVMTGGLGPTKDDITKQTLAAMFGCEMAVHAPTEECNRRVIAARGFDYNALNRAQALVPECCEVLTNEHGTAPGMWFERDGHVLVALPGVPFEMQRLMDDEVLPRLRKRLKINDITHKTLVTTGIAESMLAERIAPWEEALPEHLHLAYLPGPSGVRLRLSAYGVAGAAAEIDARFAELEPLLGTLVVGYGDGATAQAAVARMLAERGQTLAVAESCTGGALAAIFTAMAGASEYFRGGVVAYTNTVKEQLLGVEIGPEGAVSQSVAEQMAAGARRIFGTDHAIATTGVAGPDGGTEENPVGTVWIAVAHPDGVVSRKFTFGNLRAVNIERASSAAANMLREHLLAGDSNGR
jgi:nicotinamide-nucleotide amidase